MPNDDERRITEDSYVALVLILGEALKAKGLAKGQSTTASGPQLALELIAKQRSEILLSLRRT